MITEPTTMLTDYILAVECLVLAWMLYRHYRKNKQRTVLLWTLSLGFFGLSFIAGGSQHGWRNYIGDDYSWVWNLALILTAGSALFMMSATATGMLLGRWQLVLISFGSIGAVLYSILVLLGFNEFLYLVVYYLPAFLILLGLAIPRMRAGRPDGRPFVIGAVVNLAGAGVQVLRIGQGIHDHFNHNDFFHLIQMVGMVLLWVGAKRSSDRAEPYWY